MSTFLSLFQDYCPLGCEDFRDIYLHLIVNISEYLEKETITPQISQILSSFYLVSFDPYNLFPNSLKVVFVFQDVYPQPGAACGVALGVGNGNINPSLSNFIRRCNETTDANIILQDGDIRGWSTQGVHLWNMAMTTKIGEVGAHLPIWSLFSEAMCEWMSKKFPYLVFVLFGRKAQILESHIDSRKHDIIKTSHPSPLGAKYGFDQSNIFNEVNSLLQENKREPINWSKIRYT